MKQKVQYSDGVADDQGNKVDRKDFIIISLLALVYLCLTLFNLGSVNVPKTGWKSTKTGESFQVDLGGYYDLSRITYYEGSGNGRYRLEYRGEDGDYYPLGIINKQDFYKWKYLNVMVKADRIRVITDVPGGTLLELGFFKGGSREPITGLSLVEERQAHPVAEGRVDNLFDEEDTISFEPSFKTGTYFDEIYHARTAYEHLHRMEPYETTHPPLGKVLMAVGIMLFGMNPFGWRIIGALFGTAMIPLMYVFAKRLFGGRFFPFCSALLLTVDFMHFTQSRIATIDVYAVFFIFLMYYFFYDYLLTSSLLTERRKFLRPFSLSGFSFGMGAAVKWITIYGAAGLAFLFLRTKFAEIRGYFRARNEQKKNFSDRYLPVKSFWRDRIIKVALCGVLFFLVIPVSIYLLSYLPFMIVPGPGHGLKEVFTYQSHMYNYHSQLVATHPFASPWWEWPLVLRPIWLYGKRNLAAGTTFSIVSMGNPVIWWAGVLAVIPAACLGIRRRDKGMAVVFTALLSQYLPWILVKRLTFIYHYFSTVPFLILTLVYVGKVSTEKYPVCRDITYLFLGLAVTVFFVFYPVLSGMEVSLGYVEKLKWFRNWIF